MKPNKRLKWSKPLKTRSDVSPLYDTEFSIAMDGEANLWKLEYPNMERAARKLARNIGKVDTWPPERQ